MPSDVSAGALTFCLCTTADKLFADVREELVLRKLRRRVLPGVQKMSKLISLWSSTLSALPPKLAFPAFIYIITKKGRENELLE